MAAWDGDEYITPCPFPIKQFRRRRAVRAVLRCHLVTHTQLGTARPDCGTARTPGTLCHGKQGKQGAWGHTHLLLYTSSTRALKQPGALYTLPLQPARTVQPVYLKPTLCTGSFGLFLSPILGIFYFFFLQNH